MYIMGRTYEIYNVNGELAETRNKIMKSEVEGIEAPMDLIKVPEKFKRTPNGDPRRKASLLTSTPNMDNLAFLIIREYDVPLPNAPFHMVHDELV
jgi:hypothetical protein